MNESYMRILRQQFTVFPGIEYTKEVFSDKEDGQQCAYVLRICKDADARVGAVMNPGGFKLQKPSVAARLCQKEGETLIGVVNADFFYMTNGVPQGAAVIDGKVVKEEMKDKTHFFGIRHDGTYVMGDSDLFQSTKHTLRMAVSGRDILVDGDELPEPVLEPKPDRHPRTAVCVCENGDLLLVVLDGRHAGVAEGMYLNRFALYLKSLGAERALNLDGGGSSVMAIRMPGERDANIVNVPSDGIERPCANGIAVYSRRMGDGVFCGVHVSPQQEFVAPGTRLKLTAKGLDSLLGLCELTENITFSVPEGSTCSVSADGVFCAAANECDATVNVSEKDQLLGSAVLHVRTPDALRCPASCICTEDTVNELDVTATLNGCRVLSNASDYDFYPQQDIGRFDEEGRFRARSETCEGDVLIRGKNSGLSTSMHIRVGRLPQWIDASPDTIETIGCTLRYDRPVTYSPRRGDKVFNVGVGQDRSELRLDVHPCKKPKAVGMWIHSIAGELPDFVLTVLNGETAFDKGEPSDAVWTYMEAPVPDADITPDLPLKIAICMNGAEGAQFAVDGLRLVYDFVDDDARMPEIKRISIKKHPKSGDGERINITAYTGVGDMKPALAPIDCNRLRILIDGTEYTDLEGYCGTNKGASSLMLHNFPVSSGVHRMSVCAQTYDGNQVWETITFDTDQLETIQR